MDLILFGVQGSGKGTQSKLLSEHFGFTIFETGGALRVLGNEMSPLGIRIKNIMSEGKLVPSETVMEIIEDFISKLARNQGNGIVNLTSGISTGKMKQTDSTARFQDKPTPTIVELSQSHANNKSIKRGGAQILFDGIPRSLDQKNLFDSLMEKEGRTFKGVLIDLSPEEAMKRLTTRRLCENCKTIYPVIYKSAVCEKCSGNLITRHDDTELAIKTRIETFYEKTLPVIKIYEEAGLIVKVNGNQSIEQVSQDLIKALENNFENKANLKTN